MNTPEHETFNDWWNEVENFATRGERLMEDVEDEFEELSKLQRRAIKKLAEIAWKAARGELE